MSEQDLVLTLGEVDSSDTPRVGGKNASLGEMLQHLGAAGVRVPDGFATTAAAYRHFLAESGLDAEIRDDLARYGKGERSLEQTGRTIRRRVTDAELPPALRQAIVDAYRDLAGRIGRDDPDVAVRSSATAEDLPEASFAGQQETYLNVVGEEDLLEAARRCMASLFTDRAIAYRERQGFDHLDVALSVGVQEMVRSDQGAAGVLFTVDTETGFPRAVVIDAAWGLGEGVVSGRVDPDEYVVYKPLLDDPRLAPVISRRRGRKATKIVYARRGPNTTRTVDTLRREQRAWALDDADVLTLARWGRLIEQHYGRPMDVEWARDGRTGDLYVVQARPETVQSTRAEGAFTRYRIREQPAPLVRGLAIGDALAVGEVRVLSSPDEGTDDFPEGAILATTMTDPDWVPLMRRAGAIVTEHGGRTSHAAIVSRELGVPAVVGTGNATSELHDGMLVTVSCAEGDEGHVFDGEVDYETETIDVEQLPTTRTDVMLNLASPAAALRWWRLPATGVGLARMEFVVNNYVKAHPMALLHLDEVEDTSARRTIRQLIEGYDDPPAYFVEQLAFGLARIAASQHPDPVIVRLSDFKTNEYADLVGGRQFEPVEANPMLGWRGASRYAHAGYREGFALECAAIRRVRDEMGLTNVVVMVPFCRTLWEADAVLDTLAGHGLVRGRNGLEIYVMAEIPSNVLLAAEFAERFDGFSIGSNDLTQLVLGIDRDSDLLAAEFDEGDPAVRKAITMLVEAAHAHDRKVGFCGQAPSDDPSFARFLVDVGLDSISVTPDSFPEVVRIVADAEAAAEG